VARGVKGHAVADEPLVLPVAPGVPRRVDDRVVPALAERPVCLVRESGAAKRCTAAEREVAQIEGLVVSTGGHCHDFTVLCRRRTGVVTGRKLLPEIVSDVWHRKRGKERGDRPT